MPSTKSGRGYAVPARTTSKGAVSHRSTDSAMEIAQKRNPYSSYNNDSDPSESESPPDENSTIAGNSNDSDSMDISITDLSYADMGLLAADPEPVKKEKKKKDLNSSYKSSRSRKRSKSPKREKSPKRGKSPGGSKSRKKSKSPKRNASPETAPAPPELNRNSSAAISEIDLSITDFSYADMGLPAEPDPVLEKIREKSMRGMRTAGSAGSNSGSAEAKSDHETVEEEEEKEEELGDSEINLSIADFSYADMGLPAEPDPVLEKIREKSMRGRRTFDSPSDDEEEKKGTSKHKRGKSKSKSKHKTIDAASNHDEIKQSQRNRKGSRKGSMQDKELFLTANHSTSSSMEMSDLTNGVPSSQYLQSSHPAVDSANENSEKSTKKTKRASNESEKRSVSNNGSKSKLSKVADHTRSRSTHDGNIKHSTHSTSSSSINKSKSKNSSKSSLRSQNDGIHYSSSSHPPTTKKRSHPDARNLTPTPTSKHALSHKLEKKSHQPAAARKNSSAAMTIDTDFSMGDLTRAAATSNRIFQGSMGNVLRQEASKNATKLSTEPKLPKPSDIQKQVQKARTDLADLNDVEKRGTLQVDQADFLQAASTADRAMNSIEKSRMQGAPKVGRGHNQFPKLEVDGHGGHNRTSKQTSPRPQSQPHLVKQSKPTPPQSTASGKAKSNASRQTSPKPPSKASASASSAVTRKIHKGPNVVAKPQSSKGSPTRVQQSDGGLQKTRITPTQQPQSVPHGVKGYFPERGPSPGIPPTQRASPSTSNHPDVKQPTSGQSTNVVANNAVQTRQSRPSKPPVQARPTKPPMQARSPKPPMQARGPKPPVQTRKPRPAVQAREAAANGRSPVPGVRPHQVNQSRPQVSSQRVNAVQGVSRRKPDGSGMRNSGHRAPQSGIPRKTKSAHLHRRADAASMNSTISHTSRASSEMNHSKGPPTEVNIRIGDSSDDDSDENASHIATRPNRRDSNSTLSVNSALGLPSQPYTGPSQPYTGSSKYGYRRQFVTRTEYYEPYFSNKAFPGGQDHSYTRNEWLELNQAPAPIPTRQTVYSITSNIDNTRYAVEEPHKYNFVKKPQQEHFYDEDVPWDQAAHPYEVDSHTYECSGASQSLKSLKSGKLWKPVPYEVVEESTNQIDKVMVHPSDTRKGFSSELSPSQSNLDYETPYMEGIEEGTRISEGSEPGQDYTRDDVIEEEDAPIVEDSVPALDQYWDVEFKGNETDTVFDAFDESGVEDVSAFSGAVEEGYEEQQVDNEEWNDEYDDDGWLQENDEESVQEEVDGDGFSFSGEAVESNYGIEGLGHDSIGQFVDEDVQQFNYNVNESALEATHEDESAVGDEEDDTVNLEYDQGQHMGEDAMDVEIPEGEVGGQLEDNGVENTSDAYDETTPGLIQGKLSSIMEDESKSRHFNENQATDVDSTINETDVDERLRHGQTSQSQSLSEDEDSMSEGEIKQQRISEYDKSHTESILRGLAREHGVSDDESSSSEEEDSFDSAQERGEESVEPDSTLTVASGASGDYGSYKGDSRTEESGTQESGTEEGSTSSSSSSDYDYAESEERPVKIMEHDQSTYGGSDHSRRSTFVQGTFHRSRRVAIVDPPRIDFLKDDLADMTYTRRIAIYMMHRYKWYNPRLGQMEEPAVRTDFGTFRSEDGYPEQVRKPEVPSLAKAWAYFEHFTLTRYVHEPKIYVEKDMWTRIIHKFSKGNKLLERALRNENILTTKLYDPIFTPHNQLGDWGIGWGLYFASLRGFMILSIFAGLLSVPNMLYFGGPNYSDWKTGSPLFERFSAVCTKNEWVYCPNCTLDTHYIDRLGWIVIKSEPNVFNYSAETNLTFALKNRCNGATIAQGLFNWSQLVLVLFGLVLFNKYLERMETVYDEDEQTAQDYSITVDNPPHDASQPEEWRDFFERNLGAQHVTACTVAINNDDLVKKLVERRELMKRMELLLEPGTPLDMTTLAGLVAKIDAERSLTSRLIGLFLPDIPELFRRIIVLTIDIRGLAQGNYPATKVFITFETEADQRRVLKEMAIGSLHVFRNDTSKVPNQRYLFRGKHILQVREPEEEPVSYRWMDLNESFTDKIYQQFVTTVATLMTLLLVAIIVQLLHDRDQLFSAFAISAFNGIFPEFAKIITSFESHSTEAGVQTSMYLKICLFRWVNTAVVITIIIPFTSTLSPTAGLITQVYNLFYAEIITMNVIQLTDPYGHFVRHFMAPRSKTQDEMNLYMRGLEVELAERYTNMTKILFLSLWYSAIFPSGFFFAGLTLFVNYFTDRFSLMRTWKRAPPLGPGISEFSRRYFVTAAYLAMALLSSYYWTGFPYDNLCPNENDYVDGEYFGTWPLYQSRKGNSTEDVLVTLGQTSYRFCNQDLFRNSGNRSFPFVSESQPEGDEWMTDQQARVADGFGYTVVGAVALSAFIFCQGWFEGMKTFLWGEKRTIGDDQGINFSDVPNITFYIPQVPSYVFSYPLLVCDISMIGDDVIDWNDPTRPHSYYDLTKDAVKIVKGIDISGNVVFDRTCHWPPQQADDEYFA